MPPPAGLTKTQSYESPTGLGTDWRTRAACRALDLDERENFFPIGFNWGADVNRARAERAKKTCRGCRVTVECGLDAQASRDAWAIRAGLTPDERSMPYRAKARTA